MEQGRPSETAVGGALARAAHPLLDAPPWVFIDPLAAPLAGFDGAASIGDALNRLETQLAEGCAPEVATEWIRSTRIGVMLRARYVEDEVETAARRGVAQYVILGAGFDSFAYRRRDLAPSLRVFEVDYPSTQERKKERLEALGIEIPANLTFVPVDFERQTLLQELCHAGFRSDEAAFFSCCGVTWYLSEAAIIQTLKHIAAAAQAGGEIVFDYVIPSNFLNEQDSHVMRLLEAMAARMGEPAGTTFTPEQVCNVMRPLGYRDVHNIGPEQANRMYLANRADAIRVHPSMYLVRARLAGRTSRAPGL
jgi:methyltransferase (TIGR00027 family)